MNGTNGNGGFDLSAANDLLANAGRRDVISVDVQRVITADAAEFGGARTVTEATRRHEITTRDRVAAFGVRGWHGLGEVVDEGLSGEEAVRRFLPWSVERVPAYITLDGREVPLPVWANVRSDSREVLGLVGPDYKAVQNIDLGKFADSLVGADASLTMETCGSLLAGRKVFLLVRVPKEIRVGKNGDDVTLPYLLLANGHDGSMAMTVLWTMERVVCRNTYVRALGPASNAVAEGTAFRIRHNQDVAAGLAEARRVLGIATAGLTQYEKQAQLLAATGKTVLAIDEYFEAVFAATFGARPEDDLDAVAWEVRRSKVVGEWRTLLDSETNRIDGIGGTLWAALNAVTEWNDFSRSPGVRGDRRDHLKVLGSAAVAKRTAMRLALAAV
jgi:phage/plasmid-like protein (TIGR03299 family)